MSGGVWRRCLLLGILVLGGLSSLGAPVRADDDDDDLYLPGEILVELANPADLGAFAVEYHLDPQPIDQFGSRAIYRLRITDGASPPTRADAIESDRRVIDVEPNYVGQAPEARQRVSWAIGGDAGGYTAQWALQYIRLPEAHQVTRGAGITVAVLDTGVDRAHPALAGRLLQGHDFVDLDPDPSEVGVYGQDIAFGHGTHVAGLVALAAPEAAILPVRVLDRDGRGNLWVMAEALAYAANPDGNPATDDGADVINLSFGIQHESELLDDLLDDATCDDGDDDDAADDSGNAWTVDDEDCLGTGQNGIVVVAAAGNSASTTREYPAAEEESGNLAVAATTDTDSLAAFSTHGPWVNVAAPGERIISAVPGGGYATWSGTSMAAPLVAGTAALVRAVDPSLSPTMVVNRISAMAVPIGGPVPHRVDAAAAVGRPAGGAHYTIALPLVRR